MTTYLTHPQHGVHVAYTDDEIKACEKEGWIVHGKTPPGIAPQVVAAPVADVSRETLTLPKRKPGRPSRDS